MCECIVQPKGKFKVKIDNSWRLRVLFKMEELIREVGQDARAKRMGICGNTIMVKAIKGDTSSVLFEPQLRCKDRMCPVCNAYRASILARKVEELGKKMKNPHLLTITANNQNRDNLGVALQCFKASTRLLKNEKTWWKKMILGGVEHIELTHSKKTGWHLHSHILVDLAVDRKVENTILVKNGYDIDPIKKDLEHVLMKVGLGSISDIRPVTEGYGKEISKYAMKFGKNMNDEELKEMIVVMKGKRMCSKFGNCWGLKDMDDMGGQNMEELTLEDENQYEVIGTLRDVITQGCEFTTDNPDLLTYAKEAVLIGLVEIGYYHGGEAQAAAEAKESDNEYLGNRNCDHFDSVSQNFIR